MESKNYSFSTFEEMVSVYKQTGVIGLEAELDFFRVLGLRNDVSNFVQAEALLTGAHQRYFNFRNAKPYKEAAIQKLAVTRPWNRTFGDFESLHTYICEELESIPYIQDLAKYDVAKRLGAMLTSEVLPRDFVYVQNGAKIGAEKLLGRSILNGIIRLDIAEFAPFMGNLPAVHIENLLCIMKDYFVTGGVTPCDKKKLTPCVFNYEKILKL